MYPKRKDEWKITRVWSINQCGGYHMSAEEKEKGGLSVNFSSSYWFSTTNICAYLLSYTLSGK